MTIMSKTTMGCWEEMAAYLFPAHAHFVPMVAKALQEAVEAEQDRCAKIAESFGKEFRENPDFADIKGPNAAYFISTHIRALRRPLRSSGGIK